MAKLKKILLLSLCCLIFYMIRSVRGDDVSFFYNLAMNSTSPFVSDKVQSHSYQEIYGRFLMPHLREVHASGRGYRFLEIGAGCAQPEKFKGMQIWDSLFERGRDSIWIAELKPRCIMKMERAKTIPESVKILIGDQSSEEDLQKWIDESGGGNFDAIVDDGSHKNHHIYASLIFLWKNALAPGGLYFIEDLQVSRDKDHRDVNNIGKNPQTGENSPLFMSEVIKDYQEQLMVPSSAKGENWQYPILPSLKGIYCSYEACVLMKCKERGEELAWCTK